jgi:hypothetical protein
MIRLSYSGQGDIAGTETIIPYVVFPASPPMLDARGTAAGVLLTWHGTDHLYISRKKPDGEWSGAICCQPPPATDEFPQPETVYLYRSETQDHKSISLVDVGMRITFTNDPLLPEATPSARDVDELVRATNILRAAAHLGPLTLPRIATPAARGRVAVAAGGTSASHVNVLRDAINEARTALGAYAFVFTAPVVDTAMMNAVQIQELREAVR